MTFMARVGSAIGLTLAIGGAAAAQQSVYSDKPLSVEQLEAIFGGGAPPPAAKPVRFRATPEFGATPAATATPEAANPAPAPTGSVNYPIEFAVNSAHIEPRWITNLGSIAQYLLKNPGVTMVVIGHTDLSGAASANQKLSEQRATSVRAALIADGVTPGQLVSMGKGQTSPLPGEAPNSAKNRRVEFKRL